MLNIVNSAVADAKPNDLGRKAAQYGKVAEVGVLSDNDTVVRAGILPDNLIGGAVQADQRDMRRLRVDVV